MRIFSFLDRWFPKGYEKFKPRENIWYYYTSYLDCGIKGLKARNLPEKNGWECWEIRPFAFVDGKKRRAKFKIIDNKCIIEINKKKKTYPISECSFAYKTKL